MQTLFTTPHLLIHLHPGPHPVLELQWLGYAASTDFRAAALQALAFSQQHHVQGWVADDRLLGAVRPRDLDWAEEAVLAPLSELSLRRFAQLEPVDVLNRRTISLMYNRTQPGLQFEFRTFEDVALARQWAGSNA